MLRSCGSFRVAETIYTPGLTQERHSHDHAGLTLVIAGSIEETVGSQHEYARPLSVVVKPLDTEHANRVGRIGARTIAIVSKDQNLMQFDAWRWHHAGPIARAFVAVLRAFREQDDAELENSIFDLLANVKRNCDSQLPTCEAANLPTWLRAVKQQIDDTLPHGISVRALATNADVHPVYLARQFRRFTAQSITEYVAMRRTQHAAALLAVDDVAISDAAYRTGFSDQSHLCRVFRRQAGVTPLSYRRLAR